MQIVEVARWLASRGINAVPCAWLSAISIFVDEHYENYDYDLIGPRERLRIARVLREHGFRQRNGRVFEGPLGRLEFPRPTRSLASDPAHELERVINRNAGAAFATPTQVVLITWRREGSHLSESRFHELLALLREQPANLDKVRDWLRRTGSEADFRQRRPQLARAQEEGFQLRRRGDFRSASPPRDAGGRLET